MVSPNTKSASNPSVLYPHKNSQTDISRKTYHTWVWWPNRTPIVIRRQTTSNQPIAQIQDSYLKNTTHFMRFIESTRVPRDVFLVSMDATSLYTNIPQEEGITIVCKAYENFHANNPPIATNFLREMLSLILMENSFQFNGKEYLQTELPWALKWQ